MKIDNIIPSMRDELVNVLSAVFYDYPVFRFILQNSSDEYSHHIKTLIGYFCESRLSRNYPVLGIRNNGNLIAAAIVSGPIEKPWPESLQKYYEEVKKSLGNEAIDRLNYFDSKSSIGIPETPHYYLGMIGVLPTEQKKGYATKLLKHIIALSESDKNSYGICLSTELAENIPLYEHFGFKVTSKEKVEEFNTWCMFYTNQSNRQN